MLKVYGKTSISFSTDLCIISELELYIYIFSTVLFGPKRSPISLKTLYIIVLWWRTFIRPSLCLHYRGFSLSDYCMPFRCNNSNPIPFLNSNLESIKSCQSNKWVSNYFCTKQNFKLIKAIFKLLYYIWYAKKRKNIFRCVTAIYNSTNDELFKSTVVCTGMFIEVQYPSFTIYRLLYEWNTFEKII